MLRFFYIIGVLTKYAVVYILLKLNLYKKPQEKILRNFFEEAGGSFVKFGQLLALRVNVLPTEYSLELLNLFDNVPPFSYNDVKTIFINELGATPEKIFKDFQKVPFASASFGQVHAAKLEDDTILAVKVMRPGIEEDVTVDFFFIDILAFIGDVIFPVKALPWKEFADEFKRWTKNELDYRIEAENSEKMRLSLKNGKGTDQIVIPQTYHRLSTQKILVQEYIEGIPLSKILRGLQDGRLNHEKLLDMGVDIKKAPRTIVAEFFRQYFFYGFFHADPHPGNILLLQNDKIGLVDFGIVGKAITHNRVSFFKWLKSTSNMDFEQAAYHFGQFSSDALKRLIASALPANVSQQQVDEFIHVLAKYVADTRTHIITDNRKELEVMNKDYTHVFLEILRAGENLKVKLPREATLLIRALSIIGFLAKQMDYEFKLVDETKKFLDKYPEEVLIGDNIEPPLKRINRERALEELNNWLTHLVETEPNLYHLVNDYIARYNVVDNK